MKEKESIKSTKGQSGFTLIELLVVVAILGILATVGLSSFRISQIKSRDARRKSDLGQVQRALEMYYNDHGIYPAASGGAIQGLTWGTDEFKDLKETVYMKELPEDPTGNPEYCYVTSAVSPYTYYKLYARLENSQDPKVSGPYTCNLVTTYNYGVSSSNTIP